MRLPVTSISSHTRTRPAVAPTAQPVQSSKKSAATIPARARAVDLVEALAPKLDMSARVKDTVQATKETVQATVAQAKQQLHKGSEKLQDKAAEATSQANKLPAHALAKLPPSAAGRIEQLIGTARQRPVPAVVAVLTVLLMALRLLLRKGR